MLDIIRIIKFFILSYSTRVDNDDHPINTDRENTNNVFLTQTAHTTQNGNLSESRSNTNTTNVPKLPQITATATT
jgi:hypothetical protein